MKVELGVVDVELLKSQITILSDIQATLHEGSERWETIEGVLNLCYTVLDAVAE